jgi:hypothetical protein
MDGADDTQCTHSLLPLSLHDIKHSASAANLQKYKITTAVSNMNPVYFTYDVAAT